MYMETVLDDTITTIRGRIQIVIFVFHIYSLCRVCQFDFSLPLVLANTTYIFEKGVFCFFVLLFRLYKGEWNEEKIIKPQQTVSCAIWTTTSLRSTGTYVQLPFI